MLTKFTVENYKSIQSETLELGRLNVFIGENGSGKTNVLEAVAMAAAAVTERLSNEDLYSRGIRVARPSITLSSFKATGAPERVHFEITFDLWKPVTARPSAQTIAFNARAVGATWTTDFQESLRQELIPHVAEVEPLLQGLIDKASLGTVGEIAKSIVIDDVKPILVWLAAGIVAGRLPHNGANIFARSDLPDFAIYNPSPLFLRGIQVDSRREPVGINGENLDVLVASLPDDARADLLERCRVITWLDELVLDAEDKLKLQGYKLGRSNSRLYFRDRFMGEGNDTFSAENANEGVLHVLFNLALFVSDKTPRIFAVDNIDASLNPGLCRGLIKQLAELAKSHDKQALVTAHNPAVLDGLNLHDDDQRLFVVYRDDDGHTRARRIKLKPPAADEKKLKLSELWMRGQLGAIPKGF